MIFSASAASQPKLITTKFRNLRRWIGENGGFVHDALVLHQSQKPPYYTLRTSRDLTIDEMEAPAIVVPQGIIIDRQRALEDLEDVLSTAGCPPLFNRQTPEILSIFIAYHKLKGEDSNYHPLIDCLPEVPINPWLKSIKELKELEYDNELQELILKEKSGNDLIVKQLHQLYGEVLGLKLVDLLWAYAQAQTVLLHDQSGSFWPPLTNFIQHEKNYPPLMIYEGVKFVSWSHYGAQPLRTGEYLKMNLGIESPLLLYLSRRIISIDL